MSSQREPIGHPAVPRAKIQDIERTVGCPFQRRENLPLEVTIGTGANRPLGRIPASDVPIRQRHIVSGVIRAAAFGAADDGVVFEEPMSGGRLHVHFRTKIKSRWSERPLSTGQCATLRSTAPSFASVFPESP